MAPVHIEIDADLVAVLEQLKRPAKQAARELIVLELYREGAISSGKAADLMGMLRGQFIRHAGTLGISSFKLSGEELRREIAESESV